MTDFAELLRAARASRGIETPRAPEPDPTPAWRRHLERVTPDVADKTEPDPAADLSAVIAGIQADAAAAAGASPAVHPIIAAATAPEEFVCRTCRVVKVFTNHDGAAYIERKCVACAAAGRGSARGRSKGHTSWARIRTVPEYQMNEPAGSMRPMAGNTPGGPNQGVWERIPPGNVNDKAAEVARRIATI